MPISEDTKKEIIRLYMTEENNGINKIATAIGVTYHYCSDVLNNAMKNNILCSEWEQRLYEYYQTHEIL